MSTMVVTTKITTKYLMNKTKYDLSQMVLDTLDESDELRAEVATLRAALEDAAAEIAILRLAMYQREDVNAVITSDEYKSYMAWCENNKLEKL